jgi:crotonobetainyl-CoA:carnitine CoA-transferase CaiB-like acyl-CoA transferase
MVMMSFADKITGQTALQAVLAGLLARERGACQGQRIEVPMLDAFAAFVHPETMAPRSFPPETASQVNIEDVYRCWKTADGFAVGMAVTDPQYQALCRAVGRDDLVDDERYARAPNRARHYAEYVATLSAEIEKLTTADFVARAQEQGAPFAPINDFDEFRADPQAKHNQIVVEMQAKEGPFLTLRPPARYEATPASLRQPPPHLGEQTREILLELGLDDGAIAALREGGVLG